MRNVGCTTAGQAHFQENIVENAINGALEDLLKVMCVKGNLEIGPELLEVCTIDFRRRLMLEEVEFITNFG